MITAVAMNITIVLMGRTKQKRSNSSDPETKKASRKDPKEATKACARAVETWLTEALQTERPKTNETATNNGTRLASWLHEYGYRRQKLNDSGQCSRRQPHFYKATRTMRATKRIRAMLDPMMRALLRHSQTQTEEQQDSRNERTKDKKEKEMDKAAYTHGSEKVSKTSDTPR